MTKSRIRAQHVGEARPAAAYRYGELPATSVLLAELLKDSELQALFESYYTLIKIPISIIDLNANVLVSSRWQRICTEFHRVHPATCARCVDCDTTLALKLKEGQSYTIYPCANGLTDCASPILVEGQHVANLFIGQFFTSPPDEERFRQQAEEFGFDVNDYLAALREVPIVAADRIPHILDLLTKMTRVVTRLSVERKEAVEHLADREKAQSALEESEKRFRAVIEHSMDVIVILDRDGRFTYSNPVTLGLLGYEVGELRDQPAFDVVHPEDRARVERAFARAIGGATDVREEFRVRQKDGCWRPLDAVITSALEEPAVRGIVVNARDITERLAAQEAMQRSQALFAKMFAMAPIAITLHDRRGFRILDVNAEAVRLFGVPRGELIGHTALELGLFSQPDQRAALLAAVETNGRAEDPHVAMRTLKGRPIVVHMVAQTIDLAGVPMMVTAMLDVTRRLETEQQLRENEALFRTAFSAMPDALYLLTRDDGRFIEVNDGFEALFGWTREEALGRTSAELHTWADYAQRAEMLGLLREHGAFQNFECGARSRDGTVRPVLMSATIVPGSDPPLILGSVRDVSELKATADQLRISEARFRTAFESLPDALYLATRDEARIIEVNSQFDALFGYTRDEVIGRTSHELQMWAVPAQRGEMLAQLREHGVARNLEVTIRRKDGTQAPVLMTVTELPATEPVLILGCLRDISEIKQTTANLRMMEEQFRQAQKLEAVGRLAGGVAHDFNNILTVISSVSQLLLDDLETADPHREDVEQIRKSSQKAAALTRQLLAFSRKQVMNPRVVDLNAVVGGLEKMLGRLIGEDIELALELGCDIGPVRIDPGQLEQVVFNLVVNARDAMPSGGRLTIETSPADLTASFCEKYPGARPGPYVTLAVSDTGVGMDPQTLEHIFEPFFTTKEIGKGTGLGLSTVHGIVMQSGGIIQVASEPGRGTTFTIYLPLTGGEILADRATAAVREAGSETVLLVEDDADVRRIAQRALLAKGYDVIAAPDGASALAAARGHTGRISLLVTDLVMPGMPGREVAEAVTRERPGIRVLFMSGHTSDEVMRQAVSDSGAAFLQKPFTPQQICAKVREVLDAGSVQPA